MVFLRTKRIRDTEYLYLVKSEWDKKKKTGTTPYKFSDNNTLTMDIDQN